MDQDRLKLILEYDPITGLFKWLQRTPDMFTSERRSPDHLCNAWNSKNAGKIAGSTDPRGYVVIAVRPKFYWAHRLAWLYVYGEYPKMIDHANCDPSDNRICNLRLADYSKNSANTPLRRDNVIGLKGVCLLPSGRFRAEAGGIYLGLFDTAEEAHSAYCEAAEKMYGVFARFT